jgi:thiamine biosynthesis lipoprotein
MYIVVNLIKANVSLKSFTGGLWMKYQTIEKLFPALGTLNAITVRSPEEQTAAFLGTLQDVRRMVFHLDDLLSLYKESSEVSAVNCMAGKRSCAVSQETYEIFQAAVFFSDMTEGAFDVTAGVSSLLWKENLQRKRLPGVLERGEARRRTGYRNIILSEKNGEVPNRIFLKKQGMIADLGGIAKGYAADRARDLLVKAGVREAVVNFGGTVHVIGMKKEVGIQDPFSSRSAGAKIIGTLQIRDQAVVTSGSSEQFCVINGKRYHHIIDPRTGAPSTSGLVAVTLVGKDAMELDALATGCFVLGVKKSMPILQKRGIGAIFIGEDGSVWITEDLKPKFRFAASRKAG